MTQERVHFRMYHMECCGGLLCNVNARHFTFCPNCGKMVYPQIQGWAVVSHNNAVLNYREEN